MLGIQFLVAYSHFFLKYVLWKFLKQWDTYFRRVSFSLTFWENIHENFYKETFSNTNFSKKKTYFWKDTKKSIKFCEYLTFTIRNLSAYICSLRNVSDATVVSNLVKIFNGNTIILFKAVINSIAHKLEGLSLSVKSNNILG